MADVAHRTMVRAPSPSDMAIVYALVVLLGCCFGFQYSMARMMAAAAVDPLGALLWIHLVLATVFTGILILTRRTFVPSAWHIVVFVLIALFANLGQLGIEVIAAHHISAGELTLIVSLFPVFVLILAALFRTEPLNFKRAAGIAIAALSCSAIMLPSALAGHSGIWWLALTFVAPVTQAIGAILMACLWPRRLDPLQFATGNLLAGTALLAPVVLVSSDTMGLDVHSLDGIWAIIGFGATVAGEFYIFAVLTRRGGAVIASCADFVAVISGLMFGYLFFAEVPTVWMGLAAILCLASLKLVMGKRQFADDLA